MRLFLVPVLMILAYAGVTQAGSPARPQPMLSFGAGLYDVFDNEQAAEFVLEYRHKKPIFWKIAPLVGVMATTDSAVYGFAGIDADFYLAPRWVLNPNFAVGAYRNGDGKDLGHGLQFRSGLELNYVLADESRLGLAFNHISNASLGDENPGTESLLLNYSIPLQRLLP